MTQETVLDAPHRPRTRRELLEERLVWLSRSLATVDKESSGSRWLLLTALLAIPVGYKWGRWAAVFALGVSVSLMLVGKYVTWTHRSEYEGEVDAIRKQLEELDRLEGR